MRRAFGCTSAAWLSLLLVTVTAAAGPPARATQPATAAASHPASVESLLRAVEHAPDDAGACARLADACAAADAWPEVARRLARVESALAPSGLLLLAQAAGRAADHRRAIAVLRRAVRRHPRCEALWAALLDELLARGQFGQALEALADARRRLGPPSPRLHYAAARAYFGLGQWLGQTRLRRVPGGRAGRFADGWLLVTLRQPPDTFLCCPPQSALYELRRALDGGFRRPEALGMFARIWKRLGKPEVGLALLRDREDAWLADATPELLAVAAELALAAGQPGEFLRYSRLRARKAPQRRTEILARSFEAAAELYNQRGDGPMYRELLSRAVELRPRDVSLLARLADALWQAGDRTEAARHYRRVLELDPDYPDRLRILPRLEP